MLTIHVRSQEQMDNETLADDLQIEGEKQARLGRLKLTHALDVAKIQAEYGVKYDKTQSF